MDASTNNLSNMPAFKQPSLEVRGGAELPLGSPLKGVGEMTLPELLARCLRRPVDEVAWQEFVHRFHPTIRYSVEKTLCLKSRSGVIGEDFCREEVIDRVVQMVYHRLVENRCQALRRLDGELMSAIKSYLAIIAINTVREFLALRLSKTAVS